MKNPVIVWPVTTIAFSIMLGRIARYIHVSKKPKHSVGPMVIRTVCIPILVVFSVRMEIINAAVLLIIFLIARKSHKKNAVGITGNFAKRMVAPALTTLAEKVSFIPATKRSANFNIVKIYASCIHVSFEMPKVAVLMTNANMLIHVLFR